MWIISTECLSASSGSGNLYGFTETGYLRWVVFCTNPGFFMNPRGREEGGQRPLYAAGVFAEWLCCFRPREEVEARGEGNKQEEEEQFEVSSCLRNVWRMMPRWERLGSWEDPREPSRFKRNILKTVVGEKCWFDHLKAKQVSVGGKSSPSYRVWAWL